MTRTALAVSRLRLRITRPFPTREGWLARIKAIGDERKGDALEVRAAAARSFAVRIGDDGKAAAVGALLVVD